MRIKISCPRPCCRKKKKIEIYVNDEALRELKPKDYPSIPLNKQGEQIR